MMKSRWAARITGNWGIAFLSPLVSGGLTFSLPLDDPAIKIVLTAFVSSLIVTGLVVFRELEKYGRGY